LKRILQGSVARLGSCGGDPVAYGGKQGAGGRPVPGEGRCAVGRGGGRSGPAPPGGGDPARPARHHEECDRLASHLEAVEALFRSPGTPWEAVRLPRPGDLPRAEHRREQVRPRGCLGPRRDRQDRARKGPRTDSEHRVTKPMYAGRQSESPQEAGRPSTSFALPGYPAVGRTGAE